MIRYVRLSKVMVLIGIGSNQGDSQRIVHEAMSRLRVFAQGELHCSSLWRTAPIDCPPGSPDFINAAVAFAARPDLVPEVLLKSLKALEAEFGRGAKTQRNAPRELDLDLLLFDDQTRHSEDFVLPHPRAVNRRFVLAPAAEVLPDAPWPGEGRNIRQLLNELSDDEQVERLDHALAL